MEKYLKKSAQYTAYLLIGFWGLIFLENFQGPVFPFFVIFESVIASIILLGILVGLSIYDSVSLPKGERKLLIINKVGISIVIAIVFFFINYGLTIFGANLNYTTIVVCRRDLHEVFTQGFNTCRHNFLYVIAKSFPIIIP